MAIWWLDLICFRRLGRTSLPTTHIPGIYGPGIYGYLWTRYPWVSVDQFSLGPGPAPWPRPFSLGPGPARAPLMEADRASTGAFFSRQMCISFLLKWCFMCCHDKVYFVVHEVPPLREARGPGPGLAFMLIVTPETTKS